MYENMVIYKTVIPVLKEKDFALSVWIMFLAKDDTIMVSKTFSTNF